MEPVHHPESTQNRPPRRTWPVPAKVAAGCGAGCLLLVLIQFVLFTLGIWLATSFTPIVHSTQITIPQTAVVGRPVSVKLSVRNLGANAFTVRNISIPAATAHQVTLNILKPPPASTSIQTGAATSWRYDQVIKPGDSWQVQLQAIPKQTGPISGTFNVQIDELTEEKDFHLEVTPASPQPPTKPRSQL